MAVTPAGAEVSKAMATNWKKIWNKELKPQADQRYYTKKKSNNRYYTKSDSDAKYQAKGNYALTGSSYTKAESDSKYAGTGSAYTKAESDGRYRRSDRRFITWHDRAHGGRGRRQLGRLDHRFGATLSAAPDASTSSPSGAAAPAGVLGHCRSAQRRRRGTCASSARRSATPVRHQRNPSTAAARHATRPVVHRASFSRDRGGGCAVRGTWAVRPHRTWRRRRGSRSDAAASGRTPSPGTLTLS